jgi:tRNA pseudouridine55 synthase
VLLVDKPAGLTSHDVVARARRLLSVRRIGHAGTLDPMATGLLVLGVGAATRLLGHLAGSDKTYEATIRLGQATVTDDREGEVVATTSAAHLDEDGLRAALAAQTGPLQQVPSAVSAVKVAGRRSYERVRAGERVELAPRAVTVHRIDVRAVTRPTPDLVDVDVVVACTAGTYIRAIARDAGAALGVGGHLTALRRTAVGPYDLGAAHTLDQLTEELVVLPLGEAARAAFPAIDLDDQQAQAVRFGRPLDLPVGALTAVFDPAGEFLALYEPRDGGARPVAVFVG